jgi:hypothetical protein
VATVLGVILVTALTYFLLFEMTRTYKIGEPECPPDSEPMTLLTGDAWIEWKASPTKAPDSLHRLVHVCVLENGTLTDTIITSRERQAHKRSANWCNQEVKDGVISGHRVCFEGSDPSAHLRLVAGRRHGDYTQFVAREKIAKGEYIFGHIVRHERLMKNAPTPTSVDKLEGCPLGSQRLTEELADGSETFCEFPNGNRIEWGHRIDHTGRLRARTRYGRDGRPSVRVEYDREGRLLRATEGNVRFNFDPATANVDLIEYGSSAESDDFEEAHRGPFRHRIVKDAEGDGWVGRLEDSAGNVVVEQAAKQVHSRMPALNFGD